MVGPGRHLASLRLWTAWHYGYGLRQIFFRRLRSAQ